MITKQLVRIRSFNLNKGASFEKGFTITASVEMSSLLTPLQKSIAINIEKVRFLKGPIDVRFEVAFSCTLSSFIYIYMDRSRSVPVFI